MRKKPEQLSLPFGNSKAPAAAEPSTVVDLSVARQRLRPQIRSRQDVVGALVGQLASLVRGTTTADRAGEVREAATRALDLFELADRGKADRAELGAALRRVEEVLRSQRN